MKGLTAVKTATKTATKTVTKTAAKPAVKAAPVVAKLKIVAKPVRTLFAINPTMRPTAGKLLASHTIAALNVLGMLVAPKTPAPHRALLTLIGPSAMSHHRSNGNLKIDGEKVSLTSQGHSHFMSKVNENKVNPNDIAGFVKLLTTGDASGTNIPEGQCFQVA
jgi:hypothetical protein